MPSNYKKLGPYIQRVDVRNVEDKKDNLLGVSTSKVFIPSVANTVGTNFKKYKVVERRQFTYVPDTSRRGDKIGIAILDTHDEALVSQAYTVFEVIDDNELLPEYLMMWFRRPEFDRYARYKSHGSVREIFDWEEMCDVELPVPHIEKQREIVKEYHTIVDRIALNEELNHKLEETAQAIYRQWFVEFEFPVSKEYAEEIGKPELVGKPYKSSSGEMVFNKELEKDIPVGWEVDSLNVFVKDSIGGDWGKETPQGNYKREVQCVRGTDIPNLNTGSFDTMPKRFILEKNYENKALQLYDMVIEMSGGSPVQSTGRISLITPQVVKYNPHLICSNFCRVVRLKNKAWANFFYTTLSFLYKQGRMFIYENSTTGVKNFGLESFLLFETMAMPNSKLLGQFEGISSLFYSNIQTKGIENKALEEAKDILLAKMTKVGA